MALTRKGLLATGLAEKDLAAVLAASMFVGGETWAAMRHALCIAGAPFATHLYCYHECYPDRATKPAPAWWPDATRIAQSHLHQLMRQMHFHNYSELFSWSVTERDEFWSLTAQKLKIQLNKPINIAANCFKARADATAITWSTAEGDLQSMTYAELDRLTNQIANSLVQLGLSTGTRIAIDLPMTPLACAFYLGIIKAGMVVVAIADSFVSDEIATRLKITNPALIITQDFLLRRNKLHPLYEKVCAANSPRAIVIKSETENTVTLRSQDLWFDDFLVNETEFTAPLAQLSDPITILFSSGTTGDPKAIPWVHSTAMKAASDAYWHLDVHAKHVLCWPTNLGWMMGPWLIFAALLNRASIALYHDTADTREFGIFVQKAKVNVLGVVPTLVHAWRQSRCMEQLNWRRIKTFSSSAESSNPDDMLYLMWLAHYKPIIEYCGGTEIGGAYITSTVIQPNVPAAFSTPTLGLDFVLLDDQKNVASIGEVALIPPSYGLSSELLNRDHFEVYYSGMPMYHDIQLRRHGDYLERFGQYYRALGRTDDTMKLSGIKISSVAIERVLNTVLGVEETAAIAVMPQGGGPSQLIVFVVSANADEGLTERLQDAINKQLNPLLRIKDVVMVNALPRTASNKIMRRELRDQYVSSSQQKSV